ncbi:tetratricopeptide repeat protein [Candidatus Acetothermia bacterium]|nr:tetratricopeptide repeat protein [Candidatus Acetothermia bacterium]
MGKDDSTEGGLKLQLLGSFQVWRDGALISGRALSPGKPQALLKLLLSHRGQVFTQDQLMEALFPDLDPDKAVRNLHARLSELRRALEPKLKKGSESQFILNVGQQGYCFSKDAPCSIDTEEFQRFIEAAQASEKAGRWPEALGTYQQAMALYQGEFLAEDLYEEWASTPREHWREVYLLALLRQADCHARLGQYSQAIELCAKVIALKPTQETAYRQKMLYHALVGEQSEALKIYQACVKALKEQLDVEPSSETRELHEQILKGNISTQGYPAPAGAARHNLPSALTSFIGREREIQEVMRLLGITRLLTLTGSGGCGKTRLALQVATDLVKEYAHGVWLVELASVSDPALVPQALALAVGVPEETGRPLLATLSDYLQLKQLLLVLDNCEHLVGACAQLAETLLKHCSNLRVLATSREGLGIAGELIYAVPSLEVPDPQRLPALKILQQCESVSLFLERALFIHPQFALTQENARAVAKVCHQLDGIPLAIELAAARVKVMTAEQIAARLDDRFRLLTGGSRTALPRQQTLLATMDWSFQLLSEVERVLFRRASVFVGGWTLEAAEGICAGEGVEPPQILDLLTQLVEKSLVMVEEEGGEARYTLLQTIRQYSLGKLLEAGEADVLRNRHRDWFLSLAEKAEPQLRGTDQQRWLNLLEKEHENLRAALGWSKSTESYDQGIKLAGALWFYWDIRGYFREGRSWLDEMLQRRSNASSSVLAKALYGAGVLAYRQGDYNQATVLLEQGLILFRELGDKKGIANSLNILGAIARSQRDDSKARALLVESLALKRELVHRHRDQ